MARRPSRGYAGAGPAYSTLSRKKATELRAFLDRPSAGPRTETSGKRSYRDSRGRIRWGKPHVVQRYHARKRK